MVRFTFMNSSYQVNQIHFKFGQRHLKTFTMLNCKTLKWSQNTVAMARRTISMLRHETGNCYNPTIHCPILRTWHIWWESRPEDVCMSVLSHSHSVTYWLLLWSHQFQFIFNPNLFFLSLLSLYVLSACFALACQPCQVTKCITFCLISPAISLN